VLAILRRRLVKKKRNSSKCTCGLTVKYGYEKWCKSLLFWLINQETPKEEDREMSISAHCVVLQYEDMTRYKILTYCLFFLLISRALCPGWRFCRRSLVTSVFKINTWRFSHRLFNHCSDGEDDDFIDNVPVFQS
jgi:hypothetical protein